MPSYARCRIHSIHPNLIEPFVAPLSTATHSMRSFIAPEQKHPLIGVRQGRLLDKLPSYVPRSTRFIRHTPKQSLLMRAVHYKSRRPLLNARLLTMPRSKGPFRRRAIQYARPEYPLCSTRHPIRLIGQKVCLEALFSRRNTGTSFCGVIPPKQAPRPTSRASRGHRP